MTIYRSNYMPNKTIAIVPEYAKTDNYSKMSIMWLNYVSTTKGLNIQHALNGGEKKLTIDDKTYKVRIPRRNEYRIRIPWLLLAWVPKLLQTQYHKQ